MAEYRHPVLAKGQYQIIALTQAIDPDADASVHYAVATLAGDILRRDLTLFEARAWLELLLEDEALARSNPPPRTRR